MPHLDVPQIFDTATKYEDRSFLNKNKRIKKELFAVNVKTQKFELIHTSDLTIVNLIKAKFGFGKLKDLNYDLGYVCNKMTIYKFNEASETAKDNAYLLASRLLSKTAREAIAKKPLIPNNTRKPSYFLHLRVAENILKQVATEREFEFSENSNELSAKNFIRQDLTKVGDLNVYQVIDKIKKDDMAQIVHSERNIRPFKGSYHVTHNNNDNNKVSSTFNDENAIFKMGELDTVNITRV